MVEIGKFTLESLTTGMYSDPRIVFREYIQNSVDSIENAVEQQLIIKEDGRINVYIDSDNSIIRIKDNGTGVSYKEAENVLLSIGKSTKRQDENRGFRGIGRLGGLSYCDKLIFKTTCFGEKILTVVEFDCVLLKKILSPDNKDILDLTSVIEKITSIKQEKEEEDAHFFIVEMKEVDQASELLDLDGIAEYLAEVAPVPYNEKHFWMGPDIKRFLASNGMDLTEFNIFVGSDEDHLKRVYKPNRSRFRSERGQRTEDEISELVTFSITLDKENSVLGWYGRCNWYGTISDENIFGLRIRLGNILIGDRRTMDSIFKQKRFNGWVQGEIFVNTNCLIPNARRDDFEQNEYYYSAISQLSNIVGNVIIKEIRDASVLRNNPDVKKLKEVTKVTEKIEKLVNDGLYSNKDREQLATELKEAEKKLTHVSQKLPDIEKQKKEIAVKLALVQEKVDNTTNFKINSEISAEMDKKQKKVLKLVFETLSEYLTRDMVDIIYKGIIEKIQEKRR